jgi:ATP/ADP translocase
MIERILYLQAGELKKLIPFFFFFFVLYSMLNIGDCISLSLFINRVGAQELPAYFGITSISIFLMMVLYLFMVEKQSNIKLFKYILIGSISLYFIGWFIYEYMGGGLWCFGLFLINKEVSYTIVIVHFGNFILDYFSRDQLNRVLPIIYSAGRLGGIAGSLALTQLVKYAGVLNLIFLYLFLGIICFMIITTIEKMHYNREEEASRTSPVDMAMFFKFLITSSFLILVGLNTYLFIICRTFIYYDYNTFFSTYFSSEESMASFLGYYTAIALTISLFIQLLIVNRLVAYIGLKGSHLIYSILTLGAIVFTVLPMNIYFAVYCRFIENELRLGYRSSIMNLIGNKFAKNIRARSRAWTMGAIVPLGTLTGALLLGLFGKGDLIYLLPITSLIIAVMLLFASFEMYKYFDEESKVYLYLKGSRFKGFINYLSGKK